MEEAEGRRRIFMVRMLAWIGWTGGIGARVGLRRVCRHPVSTPGACEVQHGADVSFWIVGLAVCPGTPDDA